MSAIFTGKLQFGLVSIDIKLMTAEDRFHSIKLRQLDRKTKQPITMKKSSTDIIRAYDCGDKCTFVQIDEVPTAPKSEILNIQSFVPVVDLPLTMLDKAYFVESTKTTRKAYTLLLTVLESQQKCAIAKMVLRGKTTNIAVLAQDSGLVAFTLRPVRKYQAPVESVSEKEIDMAETLVESMSGFIDDIDFSQPEHDELVSIIDTKIANNDVIRISDEPEHVSDIQDVLKMAMA